MKKISLLVTMLFLLATANTFAQETTDVSVSAEIATALTVTTTEDVEFGTIQQNVISTLPASGSGTAAANLGNTAAPGEVTIAGGASESVIVTIIQEAILDNAGNDGPFTLTTEIYHVDTTTDLSLANEDDNADLSLDGSGDATLSIGGTLPAINFTGVFDTETGGGQPLTLEVQYGSL
ncbi:MAG: hypothetical protein WD355_02925 [Balneolaceae bacterium]